MIHYILATICFYVALELHELEKKCTPSD